MLADRSAFLDPPPTEIPSDEAPTVAAQQAILKRAETYTLNYVKNLPNIVCSRVVHRFDDTAAHGNGVLRLRGTFAGELTLRDGAEAFHLESISDSAPIGEKRRVNERWWEGAVTSGEFGSILAIPFLGHARFTWRHWQTLSGTRVAVIGYSVPESASRFTVYWCCKLEWNGYRQMSQNPACQGELSIDPDSGAVLRVTAQAVHLPRSFPIRQSQTIVEYLPVTLGGNAFLYPARSLSFIEELSPITGDRGHFLNRIEYRSFRRFGAESKLIADIPAETPATPLARHFVAPGFSAPDSLPISEPPAPGPLVDLTTLDLPSHGLTPVVLLPPTIPSPSIREGEQPIGGESVFRVRIDEVPVRVVVSDERGRSIGDLRKEDFELFDDEKRQQISGFHVQRRIAKGGDRRTALETADTGAAPGPVSLTASNHYIVYVFDDLNLSFGDLSLTRTAAGRAIKDLAQPATRLAVLTTSGKKYLDFTDDVKDVTAVLDHIVPQAVSGDTQALAALEQVRKIENRNGTVVTPQKPVGGDRPEIEAAALRKSGNPAQGRFELQAVAAAVRRLAVMPGDRSIVLVSPGFDLAPGVTVDFEALMNTASRKGIPINTLDARGVRVLPGFDVEELARSGFGREDQTRQQQLTSTRARESARAGLLADLAYGTGGIAIRSSNDFDTAFRQFTNLPEFTYMLIFSPRDLQLDGKFHTLRVGIRNRTRLSVQARTGYLAPAKTPDPAEQAKEEIENAVFSREEIREIPLAVQLQSPEKTAKISATMHVGLGTIRFERQNGHNRGCFTATVSVFDNDGKYFAGKQEKVELDYSDDKLAASIASGTDVRGDFDTPPGRYLVRVVIRDEDGHLSSTSSAVEVR